MEKCKCYNLPSKGKFILRESYDFTYIIDGIVVIDEKKERINFTEINWLWYFKKI